MTTRLTEIELQMLRTIVRRADTEASQPSEPTVPTPPPMPPPEPAPEPVPEPSPPPTDPTSGVLVFKPRNGVISEWQTKQIAGVASNSVTSPSSSSIKCLAAPTVSTTNVSKACMQQNIGEQPAGKILRVECDFFIKPALYFSNLFLVDLEDNNAGSIGTRIKCNDNRTFRLDGGKLGFGSINDVHKRTDPFPMDQWFRFAMLVGLHRTTGNVKMILDGKEVFDSGLIPTVGPSGVVNQFQLGCTANSSKANQHVEFKNVVVTRY